MLQAARGEGGRDRDLARLRRVSAFWFRQVVRLYGFGPPLEAAYFWQARWHAGRLHDGE